ncbi:unnamed protein product [Allacma fusca]|uniref:Uncharacterized protein n=1 Tax=Allacma fusca TaxID=39272 RepID=A0A8J2KJT7_9HEXA|nr:unnamed protein product [Allacma fusca]
MAVMNWVVGDLQEAEAEESKTKRQRLLLEEQEKLSRVKSAGVPCGKGSDSSAVAGFASGSNANTVKVRFGTTQLFPSAQLSTWSSGREERLPEPSAVVPSKYSHQQLGNIYPFTYSLISTASASSPYFPYSYSYEPAISRHIDISSSSSSSSIFYTVPLPKPKTELLGTPSILKPFRQLQEPTRFNTAKTVRPNIYVPPVRVSRNRKSESNSEVSDSNTASVRSVTGTSQNTNPSARSESRQTGLSDCSDLQVQHKPLSIDSPKMPLRVRMRRDEYYYTETSTKATQTDEAELKEKRRRSSSSVSVTTNSGRRISKTETMDRSTSPISQLASAHYLKKLEDLEKITGHFVIQRFFTRTDQDFTLWLEQQLASRSAEEGKDPEEGEPDEVPEDAKPVSETEDVPNEDTSQIQEPTDVENADTIAIIGDLTADSSTNVVIEAIAANSEQEPDNITMPEIVQELSTDSPRITDVTRPEAIDVIDDIIDEAAPQDITPEAPEAPDIPEVTTPEVPISVDVTADVPISTTPEIVTIVEVHPQPPVEAISAETDSFIELTSVDSIADADVAQAETSPTVVITDVEPGTPTQHSESKAVLETLPEEDSKAEDTEESIAKLLISLSPRTSTPIVEQEIIPIKIGEDTPLESFEKFQAALKSSPQQVQPGLLMPRPDDRKMKHSESFAYGTGPFFTMETTVLSMEGHVTCQELPPFVFPHSNVNRVKKSNSYDSCLGTELSSVKTGNDSGNSTSGRCIEAEADKVADNLNISQDSHSQTLEDLKASIEEEVTSKDSGLGGCSGRSNWFGSTDNEQGVSGRQETVTTIYEINSEENGAESVRAKSAKDTKNGNGGAENEIFSADSDTESEIVMSENYHARSEAESDTEITTDGDAVADDNLGYPIPEDPIDELLPNGDDDNTDVDDDDKDNDLLARMELDELRLEIDKPSTIRTTCTQTNRSLFSSAWSNGSSASSTTTNGSGSYIDLEVISKKYPSGPSADVNRRNYLPSSSSSLNFVNCNMNLSVKTDESKFKMSVSLPGLRPKQIQGGRPLNPRKIPLRSEDSQDLPALWAHVRNRLDSKVSLDIPASDLAVKGDSLPGNSRSIKEIQSHGLRESNRESIRDRVHGKYQRPTHQSHQQYFLQNRHNDDRIKRSLERLSKLLDIDK